MTSNRFLEHPDISLALRTGYPYPIKPIEPVNPALDVSNEEFAEILAQRIEKRANDENR